MMSTYEKPLPIPDVVSKEFWEAARRHEFVIQHCRTCSRYIFYPRVLCPRCLSSNLEWVKSSGKGRVFSYTVIYQAAHPAFKSDVPYVYAIVGLDEGPRMATNIVGCNSEEVKVGMPVTIVFEDVTPEVTLVKFKPA